MVEGEFGGVEHLSWSLWAGATVNGVSEEWATEGREVHANLVGATCEEAALDPGQSWAVGSGAVEGGGGSAGLGDAHFLAVCGVASNRFINGA